MPQLYTNDLAVGLNLTMASKVIFIDPWWNSGAEQQAFCRVFRIGQKEKTFMSRLCVQNTIDNRIIEIQERKEKELERVMKEGGRPVQGYVLSAVGISRLTRSQNKYPQADRDVCGGNRGGS